MKEVHDAMKEAWEMGCGTTDLVNPYHEIRENVLWRCFENGRRHSLKT